MQRRKLPIVVQSRGHKLLSQSSEQMKTVWFSRGCHLSENIPSHTFIVFTSSKLNYDSQELVNSFLSLGAAKGYLIFSSSNGECNLGNSIKCSETATKNILVVHFSFLLVKYSPSAHQVCIACLLLLLLCTKNKKMFKQLKKEYYSMPIMRQDTLIWHINLIWLVNKGCCIWTSNQFDCEYEP